MYLKVKKVLNMNKQRNLTKKESREYNKLLDSLYKPTGNNFFYRGDVMSGILNSIKKKFKERGFNVEKGLTRIHCDLNLYINGTPVYLKVKYRLERIVDKIDVAYEFFAFGHGVVKKEKTINMDNVRTLTDDFRCNLGYFLLQLTLNNQEKYQPINDKLDDLAVWPWTNKYLIWQRGWHDQSKRINS